MAKIRVLLAAHVGEPRGGVSTYYEEVLKSDLKDNVDLHFIETSKGALQSGDRGKWKIINWLNALENILRFFFALVSVKPDLVHIGTAYGASFAKHSIMVSLARLFFIPVILQPHCSINKLLPECPSWWRKYVIFILCQCEGIVIISREWEVLAGLIPNIKMHYIPNAIDLEPYTKLPRPRQNANGIVNILYLGHIYREKGIFDLIQAVALLQKSGLEFAVNIVGESMLKQEMDSLRKAINSNDLQGCIQIFSPEYGEKKLERLASTDIFVLPSYYEGMPMSIIEAMAAGLPVVASRVGGIPDLIGDQKSGLLIDAGDVQALSATLFELIRSTEKRQAVGAVARRNAIQKYDIESNVNALYSFYREIMPFS